MGPDYKLLKEQFTESWDCTVTTLELEVNNNQESVNTANWGKVFGQVLGVWECHMKIARSQKVEWVPPSSHNMIAHDKVG